jgi:hypothetical protein
MPPLAELAKPRCASGETRARLAKRAAPPGRSILRHALSARRTLLRHRNVTRDDALCEQGAVNIRAVWRAGISFLRRQNFQMVHSRRGGCSTRYDSVVHLPTHAPALCRVQIHL